MVLSAGAAVYFAQKGPVIVGGEAAKELCGILPLFTGKLGGSSDTPQTIARDICYFVFAYEKSDSKTCEKITVGEFKGNCYSALVTKTGNTSLCESAPVDARERCYTEVAGSMRDASVCEKIKTPDARDNCLMNYASRAGDSAACNRISNVRTRDNCYINQSYQDPSLCSKISDAAIKQECLRNVNR